MKLVSALTSLLILFCLSLQSTDASTYKATLQMGQTIGHSDTVVSANEDFELGFFSKEDSTKYYVGAWFKNTPNDKPVWVANRNYAFKNSSAVLTLNEDGNLVISDGQMSYSVTNISSSSSTHAVLLDSGNLVLLNNSNLDILWQSFDNPTDTLLPGMSVGHDTESGLTWSLRSWTSAEDPTPGNFSLRLDAEQERLIINKGSDSDLYWFKKVSDLFTSSSFGNRSRMEWMNNGYFTWRADNNTRMVLEVSGEFNQQSWSEDKNRWVSEESSKCGTDSLCGNFSICNPQAKKPCDCLHGFEPYDANSWKQRGCVRRTELLCSSTSIDKRKWHDGYLQFNRVSLPSNEVIFNDTNSALLCQTKCSSNCSCVGYAYDYRRGCLLWNGQVFNLKNISVDVGADNYRPSFFLKLDASELVNNDSNTRNETEPRDAFLAQDKIIIVVLISFLTLLIVGLFVYCYWRRKLSRKGEDLRHFDVGMSIKVNSSELNEGDKVGKVKKREIKLPLFSFASVSAATDNFSAANKLGEGGFGPVYKGKLLNGDEVAVKRLSRRSGQGWEELRNEALLIAKLQHNNLVRLLGCCIERDEKMLIYEFMPNKSLDFFLFDATKSRILDWATRVRIIEGIAQGLLYLHQYSRFRIIHRDLKVSNILLDINMNPKISDFGMARIFGENESQANTNRIVGTYGYMSPEYALEGLFSIKSDVFSFGVLLLEIVSGKKNTGFYQTKSFNLLGYAWDLWTSRSGMDLMDPVLEDASSKLVVVKYVKIALLCVQESAADRPTMSDVVSMLGNDSAVLPCPKPPAFLNVRGSIESSRSSQGMTPNFSVNSMTASVVEAR